MKNKQFKIRILPVIAFTAVVLLLVRAETYSMDIGYWPDLSINSDTTLGDVFCLIKSDACLFISVWAFLTMAYLFITGRMKIKRTKLYIPMAVYMVSVLISYALSDYKIIALFGAPHRFEGTKTILCYMFMLFYTINVIDDLRDAVYVIIPTLVAVFIANIIGFTQLIGKDVLLSDACKFLIGNGMDIKAEFLPGQVYQTVFNMNYVGMYLALVIPLLIWVIVKGIGIYKNHTAQTIGLTDRKLLTGVILAAVLLVLIGLNIYGAKSIGGLLGVAAAIVAMIIAFTDKKCIRLILTTVSVAGFIAVMCLTYINGKDTIKSIDYFVTGDAYLESSIDGHKFTIVFDKETKDYSIIDENGEYLQIYYLVGEEGKYIIDDSRYWGEFSLIPAEIDGTSLLCIDAYNEQFIFRMDGDEVKYINPLSNEVSLDKVESLGFKGHLSVGNGRGYIWSRTIPLIKKHLFFGSGADTFMMVFPQNDYAGKYSSGSFSHIIYDKPHNMYLQMLVCTGLISCLAFIVLIAMTIIKSIKLRQNKPLGLVLAAGIFGFMVAGLFNDSNVCTMPIFYGLLGVGISQIID